MNQEKNIIHTSFESIEESHFVELSQSGHSSIWIRHPSQIENSLAESPSALLPGSFNPLHEGHEQLKNAAEEILECEVEYEISIRNVEKPEIDYSSLSIRVSQFSHASLILNNSPTFLQKAELYPGTTFIVGMDTAVRILDPRFYEEDHDNMLASLQKIHDRDCQFLVAARQVDEQVMELDDLNIPASLSHLFQSIPKNLFHHDLSSTEIREKMGNDEL